MVRPLLTLALFASSNAFASKPTAQASLHLASVDVDALLLEDSVVGPGSIKPFRYGIALEVNANTDTFGMWTTHADGSRQWTATVRSAGAHHLSFQLDELVLPVGAALTLSSPTHGDEVYMGRQGVLGTAPIRGDVVRMELTAPAGIDASLRIDTVIHGYRNLYAPGGLRSFGDSGSCNVDAVCPEADDRREAVATAVLIVNNQGGVCSGTLLNNTRLDQTPYILTANHCLSNNVSGWSFWFNYERINCGSGGEPAPDIISGASLVANNGASDFGLLLASEPVPSVFGAYFAGWDHTGVAPSSAFTVHFPSSDAKKYSEENDPLISQPGDSDYWQVRDWDVGTTEGGSSGAGLYDADGRVVGQLFGGSAACGNDQEDNFGKFSVSWDNGNSDDARLVDWLDPDGLSAGTLDGMPAVSVPVDAALVGFSHPGGRACALEPSVRIVSRGAEPLTAVTVSYSVDDGAEQTVQWTGALDFGQSAEVALPVTIDAPGVHSVWANVRAEGDELAANDSATTEVEIIDPSGTLAPLLEVFDDNIAGLDIRDDGDDGATWTHEPEDSFGDGDGSLGVNNFGNDTSGTVDAATLGPTDLSDVAEPMLQFDYAYSFYDQEHVDGLRVWVTDACGDDGTLVFEAFGEELATAETVDNFFSPEDDEWGTQTINLAEFAGSVVSVRFENVGGYGQWLYIDDVFVGEAGDGPVREVDPGQDTDAISDEEVAACGCSATHPGTAWLLGVGLVLLMARRRRSQTRPTPSEMNRWRSSVSRRSALRVDIWE